VVVQVENANQRMLVSAAAISYQLITHGGASPLRPCLTQVVSRMSAGYTRHRPRRLVSAFAEAGCFAMQLLRHTF
jgi:hypothetical protein